MEIERAAELNAGAIPSIRILGTPISIVSLDRVLRLFERWVGDGRDHSVVFRDVHGVMRARNETQLRQAHEQADLVSPDGMPLVWVAKLAGVNEISRVCGPDLLILACQHGVSHGWRHYFYGGAPGVAETLAEMLVRQFPGMVVAGTQCPPFRPLTHEEDERACAAIRAAQPDFVWVGLGTPKQETWMAEHRGKCGGAILAGVGAAFDIHAGHIRRAPVWMQRSGLEWAYRFAQEPQRLWQRYLKLAPLFFVMALREVITNRVATIVSRARPNG